MSGGVVRRICILDVAAEVEEPRLALHLRLLLGACPDTYLQFAYELARAAAWPREMALARAAAMAFRHVAIELADDVCDGDCPDPLDPLTDAPVLLLVLEQLALAAALRGGVSAISLARVAHLNLRIASGQYQDLYTRSWTGTLALQAALRLNGDQFSAHLHLLWDGSRLEDLAEDIGRDLGLSLHVLSDRVSADRRFAGVSAAGRSELVALARGAAERLAQSPIACIRRVGDAARSGLSASARSR
jgi:hypothetical protein